MSERLWTWTEVVEELAARMTDAIHESPGKDVFDDEDLVLDIALGGAEEARSWLLRQAEPGEDSESLAVRWLAEFDQEHPRTPRPFLSDVRQVAGGTP